MSWDKIGAIGVAASSGIDALRKLRSGKITLDEYLDLRAELSVADLKDQFSPEHLKLVHQIVRNQLTNEPGVVERLRYSSREGR